MGVGKEIRLGRLTRRGGRGGLIVPIDHGLTMGPLPGIESVAQISRWIGHSAIDAVIAHKGMVERLGARGLLNGLGLFVHINGAPQFAASDGHRDSDPRDANRREADLKSPLTDVEAAARLGADGVSVQLTFVPGYDRELITYLGAVRDRADRLGLPVLVMLYDKVAPKDCSRQRHLMRLAIELGADALKIALPSPGDVADLLDGVAADIPVFVAGGAMQSASDLLVAVDCALRVGARGACVGRNIFMREDPAPLFDQLRQVIDGHGGRSLQRLAVNGEGAGLGSH